MKQRFFNVSIIISSLLLSSCGPLIPLPGDPPTRYTLSHLNEKSHHPETLIGKQILIEIPNTSIGLDSQRIAVIPASQQVNYFAGIEWSDRLPLLVQQSLTYSLQNQQIYRGIVRNSDGLIPDQALKLDIRKFYINQTGEPKAEAEYFVQLISIITRNELASKIFATSVKLPEDATPDIIAASLDQVNQKILRDLQDWLREQS